MKVRNNDITISYLIMNTKNKSSGSTIFVKEEIFLDGGTLEDKRDDDPVSTIVKRKRGRPRKRFRTPDETRLAENKPEITQKEPVVSEPIYEGT